MSTSTRWTVQEPGGSELEALQTTGGLLDPSEAEAEGAFRSAQARLTAELGSSVAVTDGQYRHSAGTGRLRAVRAPGDRREPAYGRPGSRRRTGGSRRPAVRAAVGLGLAASVAGGLLFAPTATLTMPWDDDGGTVPPGSASASEILQAAATRTVAAADDSWDEIRGDQFVYYRTTGTNRYEVVGEGTTKISEDYAGWFSVDGTQDGRATATYSVGDPLDTTLFTCADGGRERALTDGGDCSSEPELDLDAPTDADAMYDYLLRDGDGDGSARSMFISAGNVLRSLTPEAQAAVFGALSRVDGLIVTPGVKDAAGRPGIAVGVDMEGDYRQDLIFDPETKDLLGGASAYADGMADGYAIVERTIVDEVGQKP
ncbi:hypothetical protein APR04_004061 [Promicromonospora umidemergens]|uniref:CU044_5270 family protein n=1 Tax=Promicromonospora umidemergens TaxID=629679 RepID=A0ABP8X320_9MICO|nr:CU044_5270 family protein [Promicromonospora umidemergens]MCP2285134.1 hypothetical protein [Promicromonospora umidemergens]